ncbi:hypothetical protein JOF36_000487 [Pseudonocardia parietis]|uniref:Uncharacterized protein n=1 Tax=Pseudonocardia parietis TaxID=570936 RepID=A0ABS4VLJ0_9PSEU|nr:hypothetical protein [Pseudonocardia parietis]
MNRAVRWRDDTSAAIRPWSAGDRRVVQFPYEHEEAE